MGLDPLYDAYANAPVTEIETRYRYESIGDEDRERVPYKVEIVDFTATNPDPLTLRHDAELGGLQSLYDSESKKLSGLTSQHEAQSHTMSLNLQNLAQLDAQGVVSMVDNNINFILMAAIMYFLFMG